MFCLQPEKEEHIIEPEDINHNRELSVPTSHEEKTRKGINISELRY